MLHVELQGIGEHKLYVVGKLENGVVLLAFEMFLGRVVKRHETADEKRHVRRCFRNIADA